MSESQGKTRSAEQSFLDYCHLVVDSFAVLSKGDNSSNKEFCMLKKRAYRFLRSIGYKGKANPYKHINIPKEFMAQLFASTETLTWLYDQLKILHSNITVEKKKKDEKHEFIHPFLPSKGDAWHTTPRLPICMGWEDCGSNGKLKFPENHLPSLSYSLLDKHFLPAYLYILTAFDGLLDESVDEKQKPLRERLAECKITADNNKTENASKKLLAPFFKYWQSNKRKQNILQKIVLNHQPDFKNKYPPVDLKILDNLTPKQNKRRIFFEVQVAFDRWLSTIGIPKDWIFKYELKKDIEKKTGCMFREEGESLWEVLKYSILLLEKKKKDKEEKRKILSELFVLFWITTEKSGEVSVTERGNNLLAWWRRNDIMHHNSDFSALEEQLLTELDRKTYQMLLEESSINIPVNAFFLAMPPPEGVYRCEITYSAYENKDDESSVGKIWVLAAINFPKTEILKEDDRSHELVDIICKQKVLMGLLVDPLLRDYLKEDIRGKAKQDAEVALLKKHREMLNLLTEPLDSLTEALSRTQEDTQRLRAILYNPTKNFFSAAPLVSDYFTEGHLLHLGSVSWEVSHEPDVYKNPFAVCVVLAAVVYAIFGKLETFSQAGNGKALWYSTLELLNQSQSDPAFEQLTKTVKLLLWYHKGTNGTGEDKEKTLLKYIENVLVNNITAQPDENTPDYTNFKCIKGSLNRFKKVMFTSVKEDADNYPLLPLALIFYEGSGRGSPKITFTARTSKHMTYTYEKLEDILIRSETIKPFKGIEACLPAPRYSMLLFFLSGIIDYAVRPPIKAEFATAKIEVVDKQKCVIQMDFLSEDGVFKNMMSTFSAMARAVNTKGLSSQGNFLKPFVDFASRCSGEVQEPIDKEFSILYPIENPKFASSIKAESNIFSFTVQKMNSE